MEECSTWKDSARKSENGEVMIETTLIFVVVLACIMLMLNMGMVLYHQQMVTAAANETAETMARIYSAKGKKDTLIGMMKATEIAKIDTYRYLPVRKLATDADTNRIGIAYGEMLLNQRKMLPVSEEGSHEVTVECSDNRFGMRTIHVTMEETYSPWFDITKIFPGTNGNGQITVSAEASAVAFDPSEDINNDYLEYEITNELDKILQGTKSADILKHVHNMYDNVIVYFS